MSGWWSGQPASLKLDDLDVLCAVLDCGVEELLIPEPGTVPRSAPECEPPVATGTGVTVTPKRRDTPLFAASVTEQHNTAASGPDQTSGAT